MPYVSVWVDEDSIEDFSDEHLLAEFERRHMSLPGIPELSLRLESIYQLIRLNDKDRAFEATREMVCDALGRCA